MKPPLPPELIRLGDELEAAAARTIARRSRRQQVLNALTGLVVAVPLAITLATSQVSVITPVPAPTPAPATPAAALRVDAVDAAAIAGIMDAGESMAIPDDRLPRDLRRVKLASPELLLLPSSLRPALR